MKIFAIIFALLCVSAVDKQNLSEDHSCNNQILTGKSERYNDLGSIPDSTLFLFKRLNETLKEDEVDVFKKLKSIDQIQSDAWIKPLYGEKYEVTDEIRMVAFQKVTDKYFSFLIVRMFDIGINLKGNEYIICDQYLITTDREGNYISGLKVFDNNRIDDRDEENWENNFDKEMNAYKTYDGISAKFCQDTINIYELIGFIKKLDSTQKSDYWESNFETQYVIADNGKIECIKPRSIIDNQCITKSMK